MKVAGRGCIFQTTLGPSKQTLTFWSLESRQEGILHDGVGYLTLCQIEILCSTEFYGGALILHIIISVYIYII